MVTSNFTFLSNDGKTKVHAVKWKSDSGEYHAVLQITHGMVEYIERYMPFAEFLTSSTTAAPLSMFPFFKEFSTII